jgi:uncharacterized membrane protein
MNLYRFCLFTHLLGMLGMAVGMSYEWFLFQNAVGPANEIRQWIRASRTLAPIVLLSTLVTAASGISLAVMLRAWPQGWVRVSMGALLLIAAMGVVAGRRTRQLRRLETSGNTERLRSLILHPMLQTPIRVRITVFLSILFLMVANDTAGASLGSVAIAIALGLLWSFSSRRSSDMRAVPAANAQNPG